MNEVLESLTREPGVRRALLVASDGVLIATCGLEADPHETVNLVHAPRHAQALGEMRTLLDRWIVETNDLGRFPESDEALKAALKRWKKKAVNVEYDRVR